MRLLCIDRETEIIITTDEKNVLQAEFVDNLNDLVFYVKSAEIINNIDEYLNKTVEVETTANDQRYSFKCRIMGINKDKYPLDTLMFIVTSDFRPIHLRATERLDVFFVVKIYEYSAASANLLQGKFLTASQSIDVSKDGIGVYTDYKFDENTDIGKIFTVEFEISRNYIFSIPAKLIRVKKYLGGGARSFDYGFLFVFDDLPKTREKLIMSIFNARLMQ